MSDFDGNGAAWVMSPSQYLEKRPATYALPERPLSQYVEMQDGCRLAVDTYLPQSDDPSSGRFPTILILTPYYRRFALRDGYSPATEPSPNIALYRDFFVPRGYALVVVDVRGTGASFGTRDSFRSPTEREDFHTIADWIVDQDFSDGTIGSTGISYLGAAACFLASTGHPAVKAIAPLFAVWNTYADHFYPGGVLLNQLATTYDDIMVGLDHDRPDVLQAFSYFNNPDYAGPQPVDEDPDGALKRAAVKEHLATSTCRISSPNSGSPMIVCRMIRISAATPSAHTIMPTRSRKMWRFCPCQAGWTARALQTGQLPGSCPCQIPTSMCCWGLGIMAHAATYRPGAKRRAVNFP